MARWSRRAVAALALVGALVAAHPVFAAADDAALARALRAGGLVILVRHGATFADQTEAEPPNFDDPATQRNLNDKGKALAKNFGEALRAAGVPVGRVLTSRYNRAYETAVLAGFKDIAKTDDLTLVNSPTPTERNRHVEAVRKLLSTAPSPGTDTVLVSHKPNIVDALGDDWSNVEEGEASIFRPENGGYKLVARVPMEEWPRIAAAK